MKKLILAVIALIITIGVASAQQYMYVWKTDGSHVKYQVEELDSVGFYAPTYTLSVTTEGEGTITGAGSYKIDEVATLTATAASGYTFSQWSDGSTDNPREITMLKDWTLTAVFTETGGVGGIGVFSVSATKQVTFSKGNLQYQASTNTWRFAEHQYDYIGEANMNISATYSGWIDLFGWGTGNAPTKTSTSNSDYSSLIDWGMNPISNSGNEAGLWRTLSKDEWVYLFHGRANYDKLFGMGKVAGVNGVILLPDNWEYVKPSGVSFWPSVAEGFTWSSSYYMCSGCDRYADNTYTASQWQKMEDAGAVFLPAAGYRNGTSVLSTGSYGYYWSSTQDDSNYAYILSFGTSNLYPQGHDRRSRGFSVRLVQVLMN